MGAIHNLLKRWGFVRLDHYGLVLTPDERILSNRPVLDDGLGAKIVGWRDGDLVAMEHERWGAPKPAFAAVPPPRPVPVVAAPPPVEEDDWEWEIAMARARAAAEWAEEAAAAGPPEPTITTSTFPKTEPLHHTWDDRSEPRQVVMSHPRLGVATVIPVPKLPSVRDPRAVRPMASAQRRFPRATEPVDDTVRTHPAPASDDRTSPGIALPPAGGTRRVAAKQR